MTTISKLSTTGSNGGYINLARGLNIDDSESFQRFMTLKLAMYDDFIIQKLKSFESLRP